MRSRIIDKERAPTADLWDFPAVDATAAEALRGAAKGGAHLLTAGQLDTLQKQAEAEGQRRGYADGLAAGKAELAARVGRLTALAAAFTQPFQSLEQAVEDELVGLAVKLACHLVRREIEHEPALVHAAVHDCLAVLATNVRDVTLYLNPDDAELVRAELPPTVDRSLKVAADAELARGDLRVASSSSLVDGRLTTRCAEIIAATRAAARERE